MEIRGCGLFYWLSFFSGYTEGNHEILDLSAQNLTQRILNIKEEC
jgi:hypothetical protein